MKLPVQVIFRDMAPLPSLEEQIRRRVAKLDQFESDLMSCQVVVEATGNRHRQGHRYVVRIDLRMPGAEIVAGERQGHEDIAVALRDAFDAVTRRLEDHARRLRGQVKQHAESPARAGPPEPAPAD